MLRFSGLKCWLALSLVWVIALWLLLNYFMKHLIKFLIIFNRLSLKFDYRSQTLSSLSQQFELASRHFDSTWVFFSFFITDISFTSFLFLIWTGSHNFTSLQAWKLATDILTCLFLTLKGLLWLSSVQPWSHYLAEEMFVTSLNWWNTFSVLPSGLWKSSHRKEN